MKQSAINYFELQRLHKFLGNQLPDEKQAYYYLTLALEAYAERLLQDYPKLEAHVRVIGLTNVSKKMINDYKGDI